MNRRTHFCTSLCTLSTDAGLQRLPVAFSARKMAPAQVPHTGRCCAENCLNSGMSPHRSATRAMVVLSPPGIISPSALCNSSFVRTSNACTPLIRFNMVTCSAKDPCRARTPTRVGLSAGIAHNSLQVARPDPGRLGLQGAPKPGQTISRCRLRSMWTLASWDGRQRSVSCMLSYCSLRPRFQNSRNSGQGLQQVLVLTLATVHL